MAKIPRRLDPEWRAIVREKLKERGKASELVRTLKAQGISITNPTLTNIVNEKAAKPHQTSELVDDIDKALGISYPPHVWQRLGEKARSKNQLAAMIEWVELGRSLFAEPDSLNAMKEWVGIGQQFLELGTFDEDLFERMRERVEANRAGARANRQQMDTSGENKKRSAPLRTPLLTGSDRPATTGHGPSKPRDR